MQTVEWSLVRRVAFRFGFVWLLACTFPWPLGTLPMTDWLAEPAQDLWTALVGGFAQLVTGAAVEPVFNGSGDALFSYYGHALSLTLAAIATLVWSVLDRRTRAYPRLAHAAVVVLRYSLAAEMLVYGLDKLLPGQFPPNGPARFEQYVGEMSPMGLMWTFMQHSAAYAFFAGVLEVIAGLLLLWRRTSVAGALLAMGITANIVLMNFSYDVPVKLHASKLFVLAFFIALPQLRRVTAAILGYGVAAVPDRVRSSARGEHARRAAKLVLLASFAHVLYQEANGILARPHAPPELRGLWLVDTMHVDGVERPPLATDDERWRRVAIDQRAAIRTMTDARTRLRMTFDTAARTIAIESMEKAKLATLRYELREPDQLVLEGAWNQRQIRVTLRKAPPPLLETRGFHWVSPAPFNR